MKTTLTKVLVMSLFFSVVVSSAMQVAASEMVRSKNLKNIRDSARKGMPLTFKLGVDGEIASVNLHDNTNLASVFVLTENLSEDSSLLSHFFCAEANVTAQRSLMEAIIEGHSKREDKFGQECRGLTDWVYNILQIRIPENLISVICTYFPSCWIHEQNRALIKQAKIIRKDKVDELRKTIESGTIGDLNRQAADSLTSLEHAVYRRLSEIVALLLESKADPNIRNECGGDSLLSRALEYDNLEIAGLLIRHNADINYADSNGNTELFYAVEDNNLKAVELLIKNGADVNHMNHRGEVALDWAKQNLNNSKMVELLETTAVDE